MTYFDRLPLEVIRHEIFPFLDYDGRNAVNQGLLKKCDYIRCVFKPDNLIRIHMLIVSAVLTRSMKSIENEDLTKTGRNRLIIKLMRNLYKYPILVQYNTRFHRAVFEKATDFANPMSTQYTHATKHVKITLMNISKKILEQLDTSARFIKNIYIDSDSMINWSIINESYVSSKPDKFTWKRFYPKLHDAN